MVGGSYRDSAPPAEKPRPQAWKVYVSGFHDWPHDKKQAQGFNRWRCIENPSGRLFIGRWYRGRTKPDASRGELPTRLRAVTRTGDGRTIEWTFDTLPVIWGIGRSIRAANYDVVVNTGYGVYDSRSRLHIEKGAYNRRAGQPDAAGNVPGISPNLSENIRQGEGRLIGATDTITDRIDAVTGTIDGTGFTVRGVRARGSNDYICNETHEIMLGQVRGDQRLRRTYFIHIPRPRREAGYSALATAMAKLIEALIQP